MIAAGGRADGAVAFGASPGSGGGGGGPEPPKPGIGGGGGGGGGPGIFVSLVHTIVIADRCITLIIVLSMKLFSALSYVIE